MSISLVAADVAHEEAVEQIITCLEQLISFSDKIFSRLSVRLKNFTERMEHLKEDVQRVANKVEQVRTMNSAIVICAPAKFVEMENRYQHTLLTNEFHTNANSSFKNFTTKHNCREPKDLAEVSVEKSQFYRFKDRRIEPWRSGRKIPNNLQSAADLLLFNTAVNVYVDDRIVDPFDNAKTELHAKSRYEEQNAQKSDDSTLSANLEQKIDPLQYQPETESLQHFSLPDLLFGSSSLPSNSKANEVISREEVLLISDSRNISTQKKDFDEQEKAAELYSSVDVGKSMSNAVDNSNRKVQSSEESTAEKSRSPLVKTIELTSNPCISEAETPKALETAKSESTAIPPPPPPPPPPAPPSLQQTIHSTNVISSKSTISLSDDRANLMEAIRKAGGTKGARLRSVRKREEANPNDFSALSKRGLAASQSCGGDVMSSLAKALEQRRKGMVGKISENSNQKRSSALSEGAFAHMSARIPPPPPKEDNFDHDRDKIDDYDWE